MSLHISVVIIDSDSTNRKAMESVFNRHLDVIKLSGSASNVFEGIPLIRRTNPMVVLLEIKDINDGLRDIKGMLSEFPRISIFATSADKSSESILQVMRAGATEYLLRPVTETDLFESLQRIGRRWVGKPPEPEKKGTLITLYNPIAGMGVTTMAVNLAASLVSSDTNVALVDLNFFSGDVATFLNMSPSYTLSTVTSNIAKLDASFLQGVMAMHSSGIYVLVEPLEVDEGTSITPEEIYRVLTLLKGMFSFVIVDTVGHLDRLNLAALEVSDQIFYTFVPSLPSIKNAKRYLAAMDKRGAHKDRVKLIINRYLPKGEIRIEDIEKALKYTIAAAVPNDYESAVNSINKGEPIVRLFSRSSISKEIKRLAERIKEQVGQVKK